MNLRQRARTAGLTEAPFQLNGIQRAAEVLGRTCPFAVERAYQKAYALRPGSAGLATDILQAARKSISHWGVTTIEDVTAQVRQSNPGSLDIGFVGKVLRNSRRL